MDTAQEREAKSLLTASSTSRKITNTYKNGGLKSISDFGTNAVLWELENLNSRGQTLASTEGNDLEKTYAYYSMGFLTEIKTVNGLLLSDNPLRTEFTAFHTAKF